MTVLFAGIKFEFLKNLYEILFTWPRGNLL